jgi:hypothetical protein
METDNNNHSFSEQVISNVMRYESFVSRKLLSLYAACFVYVAKNTDLWCMRIRSVGNV